MTGTAIVMMILFMLALWGGLVLAIVRLNRADRRRADAAGSAEPGPHR